VFEAASGYRKNLGAGVMIDVNGWRALHAVDNALAERFPVPGTLGPTPACAAHVRLRAKGILMRPSRYMNELGELMAFQEPPVDHERNLRNDSGVRLLAHGHTPMVLHWGDIRQALFEALPPGVVSFSSRVVGLTPGLPGGEPAVLELQAPEPQLEPQPDQEPEQVQEAQEQLPASGGSGGLLRRRLVTADLVIAADGYYSRCKRMAFGASGAPLLPTFRDKVVWRAVVSYSGLDQMPALLRDACGRGEAMWWLAEGVPPRRTLLVYPVNDNRFVWTCVAPVADIEGAGMPPWSPYKSAVQDLGIQLAGNVGDDPKHRCTAVFRHHPREVLDLLERTDPVLITEHGYYTHDMAAIQGAPDWVRGNVLVVGDAAHTGPPDGMGLNMAWEDAVVLAAEIGRRGGRCGREALEAYCAARLPRVRDMWSEDDLVKPRRRAAKLAAAFEPLVRDSSGRDRTAPPQEQAQEVQPTPQVPPPWSLLPPPPPPPLSQQKQQC
ncbi:hypothetical protein VOLCADRAFT_87328, partial [Volvox carteri f. nagariensis]